jgi:hypothetical protein
VAHGQTNHPREQFLAVAAVDLGGAAHPPLLWLHGITKQCTRYGLGAPTLPVGGRRHIRTHTVFVLIYPNECVPTCVSFSMETNFFLNGKQVSKDPDKLLLFHRRCIFYNQAPKVKKITVKAQKYAERTPLHNQNAIRSLDSSSRIPTILR